MKPTPSSPSPVTVELNEKRCMAHQIILELFEAKATSQIQLLLMACALSARQGQMELLVKAWNAIRPLSDNFGHWFAGMSENDKTEPCTFTPPTWGDAEKAYDIYRQLGHAIGACKHDKVAHLCSYCTPSSPKAAESADVGSVSSDELPQYFKLALLLGEIGWIASSDARWEHLRDNIPKIQLLLFDSEDSSAPVASVEHTKEAWQALEEIKMHSEAALTSYLASEGVEAVKAVFSDIYMTAKKALDSAADAGLKEAASDKRYSRP